MIAFLASWVRTTLLTGLAALAFAVRADPPGTSEAMQTPITHSTSSATTAEQASRWGLTRKDWTRYQEVMTGPRGIWSPNLDPLTALGVHAESDPERRRYAEILVRIERERWEREEPLLCPGTAHLRDLYLQEPDAERIRIGKTSRKNVYR